MFDNMFSILSTRNFPSPWQRTAREISLVTGENYIVLMLSTPDNQRVQQDSFVANASVHRRELCRFRARYDIRVQASV